MNPTIEFSILELVQDQISTYIENFDFRKNFAQKGYFQFKGGKVNTTTEFCVFK